MSERTTPQRVGRYRIEGILGEGAMAVVYAGFDPDIKRQVAIKCLHAEVAADPAYRRRFLIEAQAAGHLTHPHIVTLFDVGETADNRSYIAMERLSGETLASRVMHEGYPPLPAIIDLAEQIAGALDYAHAQGVVHHDIKPENIMLSDGWQQAKVSDFGIAERGAPRQPGSRRAEIGGTPSYMALEHLRGEPTDGRSDLFSLGVVLFWLITGTLPWAQTTDVPRLLEERLRVPKPAIRPREPAATPSILLEIVHTLLAPAPADRYLRGAEIIDDLRLARREYERLQDHPLAGRIGSLRLRWAGLLGSILSLTLMLGLAAIYAKQNAAVTGLALDFGSSLGRMIASESAENLLLDDRAATRALVEDVARNEQIHYLAIADRQGKVIASTVPDQIGAAVPALGGQTPLAREGDIHSDRSQTGGTAKRDGMLLFDMPIRYQNTTVGALRLGVSDAPLRAAQKTTLWVIVAVLVLTLAAVIGAVYWLFRRLLPLFNVLGEAMLRVARGDLGHRIRLSRRDELGRLFSTFNLMNAALEDRQPEAGKPVPGRATADISQPTRILAAASPDVDDA